MTEQKQPDMLVTEIPMSPQLLAKLKEQLAIQVKRIWHVADSDRPGYALCGNKMNWDADASLPHIWCEGCLGPDANND